MENKDENKGKNNFKEWIFLRPKSYSLLREDMESIMKNKGINLKQSNIKHQDYVDSYENEIEKRNKSIQDRICESSVIHNKNIQKGFGSFR